MRKFFILVFILEAFLLGACSQPKISLPEPVTNNAVAYDAQSQTVYSFAGLGADKDWRAVHAKSYKCNLTNTVCEMIAPPPDGVGRLAATAQIIDGTIYIFGGYSVAEDGSEISMPEVWAFDTKTESYTRKADMPVPVDDTVSIVYKDRYIYLVSGWHKDDNVVNVQMYDAQNDTWHPATDWPGVPVFGHAGGSVGEVIIVCDGVQIIPAKTATGRRSFTEISACWRGDIDSQTPTNIVWRKLPSLPGKGNYRMAATGWAEQNMIVFAGGTNNPYNYNGIGYDKVPSTPQSHVWAYDITADDYVLLNDKPTASMDHRALIFLGDNRFATLGGMGKDQKVLTDLNEFKVRR